MVNDEHLTQEVICSLHALAKHAVVNCRAGDDALVEATLISDGSMMLSHDRSFGRSTWNQYPVVQAPTGRHTLDLDDILTSPHSLLIAARTVLADLLQGFGVAESPQLTPDGGVRIKYFDSRVERQVRQEAARLGLLVTEETIT
jgi:hypothetical protein